jgi:hypothetical protein
MDSAPHMAKIFAAETSTFILARLAECIAPDLVSPSPFRESSRLHYCSSAAPRAGFDACFATATKSYFALLAKNIAKYTKDGCVCCKFANCDCNTTLYTRELVELEPRRFFLSRIRIFFRIRSRNKFFSKIIQNPKFIMQNGPCESKLLIVKKIFVIVFSEFI